MVWICGPKNKSAIPGTYLKKWGSPDVCVMADLYLYVYLYCVQIYKNGVQIKYQQVYPLDILNPSGSLYSDTYFSSFKLYNMVAHLCTHT